MKTTLCFETLERPKNLAPSGFFCNGTCTCILLIWVVDRLVYGQTDEHEEEYHIRNVEIPRKQGFQAAA